MNYFINEKSKNAKLLKKEESITKDTTVTNQDTHLVTRRKKQLETANDLVTSNKSETAGNFTPSLNCDLIYP